MNSNTKTIGLVLAAAAAVGATAYYMLSSKTSKVVAGDEAKKVEEPKVDDKTSPSLSKEKLIKYYKSVYDSIEMVALQLSAMYKQAEPQIKAGTVPQAEVVGYLESEFEKALDQIEKSAYSQAGITEEEVVEAQEYYKDEPEFQELLIKLRTLFESLSTGGPKLPELPEKFTKEKILEIIAESVEVNCTSMRKILDETKEKFGLTSEELRATMKGADKEAPAIIFLLPKITATSEEVKKVVHEKHDINQQLISAAVEKYQSDPEFIRKLQEVTEAQRAIFTELGLA